MEWLMMDFPYPRVARGGRIRRHEIMVIRERERERERESGEPTSSLAL
jgi:hypothetical protein